MTITKMGGGYIQAVFNVTQRDYETGKIVGIVERIFGADEEELWERIRSRFPQYRRRYQPWRKQ